MKFNTREDIEAPIDFVFEQITDFPTFERSIMRRGGDIDRLEQGAPDGLGAKWGVKFQMRGAERDVTATVVKVKAPTFLKMEITSRSADVDMLVELVALSRARTRVNVRAQGAAKTIAAKLLFQSVRFAKQKSESRFKAVVAGFTSDLEKRYSA